MADAGEDELYGAMDWLLARQDAIERKLAKRHLASGGLALYDLTSSYFEGSHCPLAARGYNRDGKKGKLQVNWGLLADRRGCPVAVSVFEGNTADPATLLPQADKLRRQFGLHDMVLVGDRGMISKASIEQLQAERFGWITALKSGQIRSLLDDGAAADGPVRRAQPVRARAPRLSRASASWPAAIPPSPGGAPTSAAR